MSRQLRTNLPTVDNELKPVQTNYDKYKRWIKDKHQKTSIYVNKTRTFLILSTVTVLDHFVIL